jgi:hypothetical protein
VASFTIDRMHSHDRAAVVAALARAFYDDPLFRFFAPNPIKQAKMAMSFMSGGVKDAAPFDEIHLARADGRVACAAVWLPPGAYPRGWRRDLESYARSIPSFAYCGRRIGRALALLSAVDKAHHEVVEPHYYLAILGTDPQFQRSGAASAALAPVLDGCDTQGAPAYLETQKEENLAYYARHRFEVVQKIEVRDCPPMWTLRRDPR